MNISRQMDKYVEPAKMSNFRDSKKQETVGTKVKAHTRAANTMKNQERVWFTARLQMKQVSRARK